MKILMIVHGFAPECSGGTESYVLRLGHDLRKRGHEVQVLCGSHEGAPPEADRPTVASFEHEGIPVHRIHRTGLYVDNWEKGLAPEVADLVRDQLRAWPPDLVHVHHWIRLTRNLIETCHDAGVPAVCTLHDLWTTCPIAFRVRDEGFCERAPGAGSCFGCAPAGQFMEDHETRAELDLFRDDFANELSLARRVIVPSSAHRDVLERHVPQVAGRFRVVPHGNVSELRPRLPEPDYDGSRPLVLGHWGHLSSLKGIDVLLEALHSLPDPSRVRLELFGEIVYPDERERFEALLSGLDVVRHGRFEPADLARVPMDLAVLPTRCSESWSFVLDEAFLLGLPALVADQGALAERIGQAGATFRTGDAASLAKRIAQALDKPKRLAKWARAIPDLPTMLDHGDAMEHLYAEVLSSRAALPRTPETLLRRRLAGKVRQLEIRGRRLLRSESDLENAGADYARAERTLEEMAHFHQEKDKELARLAGELDSRRASDESLVAEVNELRSEMARRRVEHEAEEARAKNLQDVLEQEREVAAELRTVLEGERSRFARLDDEKRRLGGRMLEVSSRLRASLEKREQDGGVADALGQVVSSIEENASALSTDAEDDSDPETRTVLSEITRMGRETRDLLKNSIDAQARLQSELIKRDELVRSMSSTLDGLLETIEFGERRRRRAASTQGSGASAARSGRLKILMVVHQFLPRHVAGTEIYTWRLARELARRHEVVVFTAESDHSRDRFEVSKRRQDGITIHEVIHNYRWHDFRDTYDSPESDGIFRRILREEKPDVLHVQHLHYHSANYVTIARGRGIPVVYTLHDYMLLCPRDGLMMRADGEICARPIPEKCADCIAHVDLAETPPPSLPRGLRPGLDALVPAEVNRALRRARREDEGALSPHGEAIAERLDYLKQVLADVDLFVSPSEFLRQTFVDTGLVDADRIIASDNGYALESLPEGPPRLPREALRLGYVGTIAQHKGLDTLVDAMNGIDDPRIECRIWGDLAAFIEYSDALRERIRNPHTLLMGSFPPSRTAEVLSSLDALVVPSLWYENSPLTVHEAARCGIPVIASDRGGLAEYVSDGVTGLHFRLGDVDDLRAKIRSLLDQPGPLTGFDPRALPLKSIEQDARDMERRYRELAAKTATGV